MRFASTAVLALTLTAAVPALALAQTQVTSRGDIAGATTISWSAVSASPTNPFTIANGSGTIAGSTDGSFARLTAGIVGSPWSGGFTNGEDLLFAQGGSQITLAFSSPITGFATQAWFLAPHSGADYFFIDAYRGSSLTSSFAVPGLGGLAPNANQAPVVGLVDASGFDRVVLRGVNWGSPAFAIDELTLGTDVISVTPEPASLALLGTGMLALGLGGLRRRRRTLA